MDTVVESDVAADTATTTSQGETVEPVKKENDEFGYLKRNEFTSEIYKIEVKKLGFFGMAELKKLIKNKLKLDISKIKAPTGKNFAFICFRSREDQLRGIELLNGFKWKGKTLEAIESCATADPLQKRRNQEMNMDQKEPAVKKQRTCIEATCPLASMPYEQQLELKTKETRNMLRGFVQNLKKINYAYKNHEKDFNVDAVEVKASPEVIGYRNKNEFTVGWNAKGEIVVGFRLGNYSDGSLDVGEIDDLPQVPEAAKWAAMTFQKFMRNSNLYKPFTPDSNSGHVRQLMVRVSTTTDDVMIVAGVYSSNLSADEVEQFKKDLKAYYAELNDSKEEKFKCTSLYYQDVKRREVGQTVSPVEHLNGSTYITDNILDLKFRISPLAFFQVNTKAAGVLYQTAIELADPKPHSYMLDICCGTGTIGLCFAKYCKQIVGVDIVEDAIKDAKQNAIANDINNSKFLLGNADDRLQSMIRDITYSIAPGEPADIFAIVDPPRAGLHNNSIVSLRACPAIKRVVYIACNPRSAQRNWLELSRPQSKQYKGEPFFPKKAFAVDLFPHTTHTEMVVLFERQSSRDEAKPKDTQATTDSSNGKDANKEAENCGQNVESKKNDEAEKSG